MQLLEKRCQSKLLAVMLWLVTASISLYADRSDSSNLFTDGRIIIQMGGYGLYDPFIYPALPYPGYLFYSPCYPFATCAAFYQYQSLMRRKQRLQRLRDQSEQRAFGISPLTQQRNAKFHRTDESEILPGIRSYSQIRPEYKGVGEYLPEFLEKKTSPSGK